MNDQEYIYLRNRVFKITGLDIDCYKSEQTRRRLDAFMIRNNYSDIKVYCSLLENDPTKQRAFLDYLAINVSEFFRDYQQFKYLQTTIIPRLLTNSTRLNIWSAACSCGQEPYSLAMILEEISPGRHHSIIASDIDETALDQARNGGPYNIADVKNIDKLLLAKYFIRKETGFWIDDLIRKKIVFKHHNLLNDVFEQNYDLIVCRNVIIYFSDVVRNNIYKKFYNSLKTGGVMFLGGSEVVLLPSQQGFSMLNPSFYRKEALNSDSTKLRGVLTVGSKE
jgi:chemotaxis protein methyltransferase CheR